MAVGGMIGIGSIASFLQCTRSFSMPITQMSQQVNSILMALAGAERIFEMIDEPSETDGGYVTLVNAKFDEDGNLTETPERTGVWAGSIRTRTVRSPIPRCAATSRSTM